MSVLKQIKRNSEFVLETFGEEVEGFGLNADSVAYLDEVLERQAAEFAGADARAKWASLLGSFLGECIIAHCSGSWHETEIGPVVAIAQGDQVHVLNPIHKVEKRLLNGMEDSLSYYFSEFLPRLLSQSDEDLDVANAEDVRAAVKAMLRATDEASG